VAALNLGEAGALPAVAAPETGIAWWGWLLLPIPWLAAWGLAHLATRGEVPEDRGLLAGGLAGLPRVAKLAALLFLLSVALTHCFAAGAIWQATRAAYAGAPEYFRRATVLHLFRMSHQHAFGHGTMYLLLSVLALLGRGSRRWKALGIALAFLGALADLASWWLQKFGGPSFEPLSFGGGAAFGGGFLVLTVLILRDLAARRAR
jgi:hypothetical protein